MTVQFGRFAPRPPSLDVPHRGPAPHFADREQGVHRGNGVGQPHLLGPTSQNAEIVGRRPRRSQAGTPRVGAGHQQLPRAGHGDIRQSILAEALGGGERGGERRDLGVVDARELGQRCGVPPERVRQAGGVTLTGSVDSCIVAP